MNWREAFDESRDFNFRCSLLRAVLRMKVTVHEISDCIVRMELLPIGLQSYVAWDIVCKPQTTIRQFNRVKDNAGMLATTDEELVNRVWLRNHEGNLTQLAPDSGYAPREKGEIQIEKLARGWRLARCR